MPDDIKNIPTTWTAVALAQDETWQCLTGKLRVSLDTTPSVALMSLENGVLLEPLMAVQFNSGDVVRYRRASTVATSVARKKG